jgi:murein DD-endopeptidase MepM/ murein hydrolase activator NlpD
MKWPKPTASRLLLVTIVLASTEALLPPAPLTQPVRGARHQDWNPHSFWYSPWGKSGVHKGIDIFAGKGETVMAAQSGLVLWHGEIKQGGKVVLILTRRGWLHYYAHLDSIRTRAGAWVVAGAPIGEVGTTGNARGKPPHLHYAVLALVPQPWDVRWESQGWKRMFYQDPARLLP